MSDRSELSVAVDRFTKALDELARDLNPVTMRELVDASHECRMPHDAILLRALKRARKANELRQGAS